MGPLRKRSWWQKVLFSRLTLLLLLLASAGLTFAVHDRFVVEREMAVRRAERAAELARESGRQAELKEKVDYLENDQGMEAEIRRHFDVALEGEQVVVIVGDKKGASATATAAAVPAAAEPQSFWRRFWPW